MYCTGRASPLRPSGSHIQFSTGAQGMWHTATHGAGGAKQEAPTALTAAFHPLGGKWAQLLQQRKSYFSFTDYLVLPKGRGGK